ncbi:hypothetical protein CLHUN_26770 [Ruminiclostridium hungatei]|uniref:eCIS core domain-containing protein n=1 Tax=Ruminiclostridium hungatei TaxID=48256 RepID=A0A1V4SHB8_RUMHU|nr:DUF4157 domain-containing protein [Ruminiclostridium hungatei]OPX43332.1 hypothetical protein CLHUN_26770 [Ruminiclostridium hungatei]
MAEKPKLESKSDGKTEDMSLQDSNTKNPIQMVKQDVSNAAPGSGIPGNLRAGLEKLSGVDLSDVKVHQNSDKPQQVGALAYTKGNDIHIAPRTGKVSPS